MHAENEALRWLAGSPGFPATAGGCFVQGGTQRQPVGAARRARRRARGRRRRHAGRRAARTCTRRCASMLRVMDAGAARRCPASRLTGEALREALDAGGDGVFAVVATAGTTNLGLIDDLAGVAEVCRERGLWLHVDGAYGLAALCAPCARERFAGIEQADSFIVDPHKWLFSPFDWCALVYREPGARPRRAPPARVLPGGAVRRRRRVQPVRLRRPPHAPGARAAVLVRARRPRHRRVHRGGRDDARPHPRGRGGDPLAPRARAAARAGAVRARLPPPRLGGGGLRPLGGGPARAGTAFVMPTTVGGEPVARLAMVNPRDDARPTLRLVLNRCGVNRTD